MHRRYGAYWSRFSQPDPYDGSYNLTDPQSLNRYAYVQNDPVNFVDPSGLVGTGEGGGGDPTKRHMGGFLGGLFGGFGALNWSVTTTVPIPWLDNMRITFTINYTLLTPGGGLIPAGRPSGGAGGGGEPSNSENASQSIESCVLSVLGRYLKADTVTLLKVQALNAGIGVAALASHLFIGHAGGALASGTVVEMGVEAFTRFHSLGWGVTYAYGALVAGIKLYPRLIRESFNNKTGALRALEACYD